MDVPSTAELEWEEVAARVTPHPVVTVAGHLPRLQGQHPGRADQSVEVDELRESGRQVGFVDNGVMADEANNYITPAGFRRLQDELARLWKVERPPVVATVAWAAGNGDRSENGDYIYGKKRLREIDRRIRYLSKSLDRAVVVDNAGKTLDRVRFGATVTYADERGAEHVVTIVGVDELDADAARVSWRSPLARALLNAKVGDTVTLRAPRGPEDLEVLAIRYDAPR